MRTPLEMVVSLAMREHLGYDPRQRDADAGPQVPKGEAQWSANADPARLDLLAGLVVSYLAGSVPETARVGAGPPQRLGSHQHLSQADALLQAHLDRPLDAGTLADALFISPGYLRQIFHAAYGHGPMHRLLGLRIDHAKKLLHDSALPVGEVARRCGFASPFHFSRVFRRFAGMPPSTWSRSRKPA
jgi:AraC family transcriptional regulator of arabinose operon